MFSFSLYVCVCLSACMSIMFLLTLYIGMEEQLGKRGGGVMNCVGTKAARNSCWNMDKIGNAYFVIDIVYFIYSMYLYSRSSPLQHWPLRLY